jgi:hypothetical protein
MFAMYLLGDERAEFDGVCDEQEEPVEEGHAVGIPRSPVFEVLDVEDDAEGNDGEDGGPEAEVAGPYIFVVLDLKGGLDGGGGDEGSKRCLLGANCQQLLI